MIRRPPRSTLFPSRRSSDLFPNLNDDDWLWGGSLEQIQQTLLYGVRSGHPKTREGQMLAFGKDRSEEHRLNSSHSSISYAVFCLKKKKNQDRYPVLFTTYEQ